MRNSIICVIIVIVLLSGYRFAPGYKRPLLSYAAWLYKYRDSQSNVGDAFYKYWDNSVKRLGATLNQAMKRTRLKVNLMR